MTVLDQVPPAEFAAELAPLFEGAPRFLRRLAEARPFERAETLFARARTIAMEMPEAEQVELLDAHPRIGADPSTLSAHSVAEQGQAADETAVHLASDLRRLNDAYERTFGFRFVVFVAGRPRAAILPLLEAALDANRDDELRRGLTDVVAIAADRARRS
jgi:2-oxo-4-hydroxy-4-carboxy--5-ureidoimidazoline (OHCU) decarboxylase